MTAEADRKQEDQHEDKAKRHREQKQLDEALDDSFPASDPPAITQPTPTPEDDDKNKGKDKTRRRSAA